DKPTKEAGMKWGEADTAPAQPRPPGADATGGARATKTRLAAAAALQKKPTADLAETTAQSEEVQRDLADLPDPKSARTALDGVCAAAVDARQLEAEARAAIDRLTHRAATRRERSSSIDLEERAWRNGVERAT